MNTNRSHDDELEKVLARSLRAHLDSTPAPGDLAQRARRRAGVIRRRRAGLGTAAVVAAVASVVAVPQIVGDQLRPAPPAQSSTSAPSTTPLPSPSAFLPITDQIPANLRMRAGDFPGRTTDESDYFVYARSPVASGQACNEGRPGQAPINAMQNTRVANPRGWWSSTAVVTLWEQPEGALTEVADDSGSCRFGFMSLTRGTDDHGRATVEGTGTSNGLNYGVSVVLVGPALVSVTVTDSEGRTTPEQARAEASRAAQAMAARADQVW